CAREVGEKYDYW
nr:immunoglobulin heavy chain junction region [Macaca mulatta]MOW99855.1 immunoglobulin heavy chain junction region [Macaca mulatta]MOW99890.1 immunoglobulin heavy chain junction region [Macaca mulatta]MOW99988.1 immunoglobulin heavy chain junction region [Macaca mulatta]MOX00890.1 immunoglobulin heavy chain junction region [Macaca mulatta]